MRNVRYFLEPEESSINHFKDQMTVYKGIAFLYLGHGDTWHMALYEVL